MIFTKHRATLLNLILVCFYTFARPAAVAPLSEVQTLITDMAYYKFLAPGDTGQAGDLLEHSLWVHYATLQLFHDNSPFVQGYEWTLRDQQLLSLAGFLHDVGKAGRTELFDHPDASKSYHCARDSEGHLVSIRYPFDHEAHAMVGFNYLINPTTCSYLLQTGSTYNFKNLFNKLEITPHERKLIAVLVGIHYTFGKIRPKRITNDGFIDQLQELATAAGYGEVDEYLLRMAVLIQVADVMGMTYVAPQSTWLLPDAADKKAVRSTGYIPWERYGYADGIALRLYHELMDHFTSATHGVATESLEAISRCCG